MKEKNNNIGYLTEEILYKILLQNKVGDKIIQGFPKKGRDEDIANKYNITYFRKKYDIAIENDNKLYLIEFDGILHYTSPKQYNKDIKFTINNDIVETIRIPFFVQLTDITYDYYFGMLPNDDINNVNHINFTLDGINYSKYPHGFISDIAKSQGTPAWFCGLGMCRFIQEIGELPTGVNNDILKSLKDIKDEGVNENEVFMSYATSINQ